MENPERLQPTNPEETKDFVIRLAEDWQTIRGIEAEVNDYIESYDLDYASQTEAYFDQQIENLNSLLPSVYESSCSVVGKVYYGDADEIESDQYSFYSKEESNTDIIGLKGVEFHGFQFREIPGQTRLSAFLMFTEPDESDKAYYFLPENIAGMSLDNEVDVHNLRHVLQACVIRQREELAGIEKLEAVDQFIELNRLAQESSSEILARYQHDEVVIETDTYYRIEFSRDNSCRAVRVDVNDPEHDNQMIPLPTGFVQGCTYIEVITNFSDLEQPNRVEELEIDEPCIVLTDLNAIPIYMIPIGKFRDALII